MRQHKRELLLYLDESGSRDPDRSRSGASTEPDWFGLGGVLVDLSAKAAVEDMVFALRQRWPSMKDAPLRSYDIRNKTNRFRWLADVSDQACRRFYGEVEDLVLRAPLLVLGCVVHRPGYNARYLTPYGPRRWKLCRTSFTIAVERAAKYAIAQDARMRVFVEQTDKPTERQMKAHFDDMRRHGLPFDTANSAKYRPLTQQQLHATLLEFGVRSKTSLLMQLADITLWPICKGGYDASYRPYRALQEGGKLLDRHCTEQYGLLGVKYSCFPDP